MGMGIGVVLFVIGALLAFALDIDPGVGGLDLVLIGYILMLDGVVVFVLGLLFRSARRAAR
jgi:hypothetical protein